MLSLSISRHYIWQETIHSPTKTHEHNYKKDNYHSSASMIESVMRFLQAVLFDLRFKMLVSRKIAPLVYFLSLVVTGAASIGVTVDLLRTLLWDLRFWVPTFLLPIFQLLLASLGIAVAFLIWILTMIPVRVIFELTLSLLLIADKVSLISESFPNKE